MQHVLATTPNFSRPLRLHLGCGERYLAGYVNVDHGSAPGVQTERRVDVAADLRQLSVADESCAEVRSHHVFEHFSRAASLALLLRWHDWLQVDGLLVIETPDLTGSLAALSPQQPPALRAKVLRHLFGSQEADWANHLDAWDEARFRHTLPVLGFRVEKVEHADWQDLHNVTVAARKMPMAWNERAGAADAFLQEALVDHSESELRLLEVWRQELAAELLGEAADGYANPGPHQ